MIGKPKNDGMISGKTGKTKYIIRLIQTVNIK
jgi:hypothetical protein